MIKYSYHRESINILSQFVAAFDDAFVFRYDKNGNPKEKIKVRYVFGPKQRVLYDIVDQAKNISLPVIALEQTNIKRDPSRIQFKDQNINRHHLNSKNISKIPSPIPVTMDIKCSIVADYKEDIDQIASNIIAYMNPYLVISWKVPKEFGLDFIDELRSEVNWSGDISFENPTDIDKLEKYRIIGNTSFTIKGWIFPSAEQNVAPIYVVRPDFYAVDTGADIYSYDYTSLSAISSTTDFISISAYPEFTNQFINGLPYDELKVKNINGNNFTFYGKRYEFNNSWYLSSNHPITELVHEEVKTAKFPLISAYRIPDNLVTTINDNIVSINFKSTALSLLGDYTFITSNEAGWGVSSQIWIGEYSNILYNNMSIVYNGATINYSD